MVERRFKLFTTSMIPVNIDGAVFLEDIVCLGCLVVECDVPANFFDEGNFILAACGSDDFLAVDLRQLNDSPKEEAISIIACFGTMKELTLQ